MYDKAEGGSTLVSANEQTPKIRGFGCWVGPGALNYIQWLGVGARKFIRGSQRTQRITPPHFPLPWFPLRGSLPHDSCAHCSAWFPVPLVPVLRGRHSPCFNSATTARRRFQLLLLPSCGCRRILRTWSSSFVCNKSTRVSTYLSTETRTLVDVELSRAHRTRAKQTRTLSSTDTRRTELRCQLFGCQMQMGD